jgi:hypothetical protein
MRDVAQGCKGDRTRRIRIKEAPAMVRAGASMLAAVGGGRPKKVTDQLLFVMPGVTA